MNSIMSFLMDLSLLTLTHAFGAAAIAGVIAFFMVVLAGRDRP